MDAIVGFILAQDPTLVVVLLMIISALENVFPPVPADVAAALGTFWAVLSGHSPIWIGFLCFAANQASAIAVYALARSRGEDILKSRAFSALMPPEIQVVVGRNIERFGGLGVFLSRFLPGLRAAVLPFAAIHGLSPRRALLPAAAASLLWYSALTVVGSAIGLAYDDVKTTVARITGTLGAVGLAIIVVAVALLWKARRTTPST